MRVTVLNIQKVKLTLIGDIRLSILRHHLLSASMGGIPSLPVTSNALHCIRLEDFSLIPCEAASRYSDIAIYYQQLFDDKYRLIENVLYVEQIIQISVLSRRINHYVVQFFGVSCNVVTV